MAVSINGDTGLSAGSLGFLIGQVCHFAMATPPSGFIKANGAAVSRTTYARLFAVIGTTYGIGDGSTTFNVPDLRGEFVRGWDDARGVDAGRAIGTAQTGDIQNHTHTVNAQNRFAGDANADGAIDGSSSTSSADDGNWYPMDSSGGGAETRPRNVAMLTCIFTGV